MIETFTIEQQKAIEEKIEQLKRMENGENADELASIITKRRLNWLRQNKHLLRKDLPLSEAVYRLLIYNHMKVEDGIKIDTISENSMIAECRNFCPYLEACKELNLDTKFVCKEIGEPSIVAFMKEINSNLHFSREYNIIRPYSDYCVDIVEERK